MNKLSIEITQLHEDTDPEEIQVMFPGFDAAKAVTRLPFNTGIGLPAVLKILERPVFSQEWFTPEEREWMIAHELLKEEDGDYFYSANRTRRIGELMFAALIQGSELGFRFKEAVQAAEQAGDQLHIEIKFDAASKLVGAYPWELLYHGNGFLCGGGKCTVTRYINFESQYQPVRQVSPPMKVLLISPRPKNLPGLGQSEMNHVQEALNSLQAVGQVKMDYLQPPTFDCLKLYLSDNSDDLPHILHFDGHGAFGRLCPQCSQVTVSRMKTSCAACGYPLGDVSAQGYLAFEKSDGCVDFVSAENFANTLGLSISSGKGSPQKGLTLVILSACKTATAILGENVFNGVAQRLMNVFVPAVIAMQFAIREDSAAGFARALYKRIAKGDTLVDTISWGRNTLNFDSDQWYRPVLYLRWRDNQGGRVFQPVLIDGGKVVQPQPPPPAQERSLDDFLTLTERFEPGRDEPPIYAVDQRNVIKGFVRMLLPKFRKEAKGKILALQGNKATGKNLAIMRFTHICNVIREEKQLPLVHYKIALNANPLSPRMLAREMFETLSERASYLPDLYPRAMLALTDVLKILTGTGTVTREAGTWEMDPIELGKQVYRALDSLSDAYTIVLMFEMCHSQDNKDTVTWLITNLLSRINEDTHNIVIVLTTETDLDLLKPGFSTWPLVEPHRPISQLEVDDLIELARRQYGVPLRRELASKWAEKVRENTYGMDMVHTLMSVYTEGVNAQAGKED